MFDILKVTKFAKHNKTGNTYFVLSLEIVNATNSNDGQRMILYANSTGQLFVRELEEFLCKFTIIDQEISNKIY